MRVSTLTLLVPLFAFTGCPQLLGDYSVGSGTDAGRTPDASSGESSGAGVSGGPTSGTGGTVAIGGSSGSSTGGSAAAAGDAGGALGGTTNGGSGGSDAGSVAGSAGMAGTGGTGATGGSGGSVGGSAGNDACALVMHDNGLGETWQDCVPLYTFSLEQALKACEASGAAECRPVERCGIGDVQGYDAEAQCIGEWAYEASLAGNASPTCNICSPGDPTTERWR